MHTLHLDHVGPLPSTKKKYNHLLVIVDAFTKFTWIFATKSIGTAEVLKNFGILQQIFGNLVRVISDCGTAFTSHDFNEFCEAEGIRHLRITTGVPRGNRQVERVNAIVEGVMTQIVADEPKKWFKHVSKVQKAINGTYQRSTKVTPFELMVRTKIRGPEDNPLNELIEQEVENKFQEDRKSLRAKAVKQIAKTQEENKRGYNLRRREATKYKVGDIVAIKRTQHGPCLKLAIKFLGPYQITRCDPHDRYAVEKIGKVEGPQITTSAADYMKPWRGFRDDLEEDDLESDQVEAEEEDEVPTNEPQ